MSRPMVFSLAATLLWGIWGITAKLAADRIGHWPSLFVYSTTSFLAVLLMFKLFGSGLSSVTGSGMLLAVTAGLSGALAIAAFQKALSSGPLSTSISLTSLYPILPVIYGVLLLNEKITMTKGIGILLALAAGVLLSL
ncbi:MAG: EamA family transporter [Candidatus Aegiribacteria sp.]|nr:EamA family transporter [Candidatus Aegiribacteria sp.]MBD3294400.1 EamA family transporter [Candidatus Fermentibacteria bacterium]